MCLLLVVRWSLPAETTNTKETAGPPAIKAHIDQLDKCTMKRTKLIAQLYCSKSLQLNSDNFYLPRWVRLLFTAAAWRWLLPSQQICCGTAGSSTFPAITANGKQSGSALQSTVAFSAITLRRSRSADLLRNAGAISIKPPVSHLSRGVWRGDGHL